ncbi:uroporphyrinogen-III C-methyltransferase [Marinobacter bryozoorum]|uniref:uroporphyrinogen-III C-methyltransferase n=1 Tax=Marinobacter bryozoorum TaxID=256324 RepID=UPI0020058C85|nr:uroporphyrinogen-III C-methyltransferase [Marinobacter bryozoorum]MCK7544515.1 uroporphyrinogen-III C-methyltransferase [Marinobacter bryozoorum]
MPVTESNNQLPATTPHTNPPSGGKTWPLWIFCLILLVGLVALSLWSWQQWLSQQKLEQSVGHVSELNRQLDQRLDQGTNDRSDRLQSLESSLREQQQQLGEQQRQIDHNARELLDTGNRTRTDWLLAEAEYLLRIANQRLLIEQDIRGALAALNSADDVLRETDDVGTYPVRERLAREIMALRSVTDVDRTGLYLKLEAARETVTDLTDQALIKDQAPGSDRGKSGQAQASAEEQGPAARAWQRVTDSLANVVSVRRLDEPVKPLLSPDQSAWARLNLQLMLEQAELAVLRGHEDLYTQALEKAVTSLETWYDGTDNRVTALRDTLAELRDQDINPELPDISQSLTLLKGRIAGRHANNEAEMDGDAPASGNEGDDS